MTTDTHQLTDRRQSILAYVIAFKSEHGVAPSIAEISENEGIDDHAIHRHLGILEDGGWIQRRPNTARAIKVLRTPDEAEENNEN